MIIYKLVYKYFIVFNNVPVINYFCMFVFLKHCVEITVTLSKLDVYEINRVWYKLQKKHKI